MDVSNSTGENTGYRVMGGGQTPMVPKGKVAETGGIHPPKVLVKGELRPQEYVTLELKEEASWVEFDYGGKPRAFQVEIPKGKSKHLLVALVPNGDGTPKPFVCRRKA